MKFFDYSEAERKEWRESDITKAYIEELTRRGEEAGDASIASVSDGNFTRAAGYAGELSGFTHAVGIAQAEKTRQ